MALTLSIFVLSFALAVSFISSFYLNDCDTSSFPLLYSLWSSPPSLRCTEGHGYVLLQLIISAHHVAHFPSRSSISAIFLRWHSVWGARSPQIQALSLVSVFSVSIRQGCSFFECSTGSSRIISKCIHRMRWGFYWRFICGSWTSIGYGAVHSWTPCWHECLINPLTCAPDPIFRPRCGSYHWRLHRSNGWHQMGIHHQCQSVFIHFSWLEFLIFMLLSRLWCCCALWNSTPKRNICTCYSPTSRQKIRRSGGFSESTSPSSTRPQHARHDELSMGQPLPSYYNTLWQLHLLYSQSLHGLVSFLWHHFQAIELTNFSVACTVSCWWKEISSRTDTFSRHLLHDVHHLRW